MRFFLFYFALFFIQSGVAYALSVEEQLKQAIYQQQFDEIQRLLKEYQEQADTDPIVINYATAKSAFIQKDYTMAINIYRKIISQQPELNSIRMELAIALFADRQDKAAQLQFNKIRSVSGLPENAYQKIQFYLDAINQRNEWQFNVNLSYVKTDNVEYVSNHPNIENTGFIKSHNMLPQKAQGIVYNFDLGKDFNLLHSHYLSIHNEMNGKLYWNNHKFDDLSNRILLGYAYKKHDKILRIQPFYDRRWYGNNAFHWSNGIQVSYDFQLSYQLQNQTLLSFEKRSFFGNDLQSGNIKTISDTLLWFPNPTQLFYIGGAVSQENTKEKQYSSTSKNIRFGWLQEYPLGISTQFGVSFTHRKFHDEAVLAGILPLGKTRLDKVYSINTKVWKRDWHIWGITPKLNFLWKKQNSNLATLYSYNDKQFNVLFEKSF